MQNNDTYIIIPAYNETEKIKETIDPLLGKYNVVVVDDGSKTSVESFLEGTGVYYLKHLNNLGQGAALRTGMDFALRNGCKYIVHFDADGQHNYKEIPEFLNTLESGDFDIVLGSRFIERKNIEAIPKLRRYLLRIAKLVNNFITGVKLTDAHNGFRAMTSEAAEKIRIHQNRMSHATEIISEIKRNKLRYKEIPTYITYSDYSQAKGQSGLNSINIIFDLLIGRLM